MQDIHEAPSVKTMVKLLTTERNNDLILKKFGHPPFISLKECKHEALLLSSGD